MMDNVLKIQHTIDAQFGLGAHKTMPFDIIVGYSKRTKRIRSIRDGGNQNLLATLRPDGGLAISIIFAQMLLSKRPRKFASLYCVEITSDAAPFVAQGKSVFCKHIVKCGKNIRAGSDVPVLYDDKVIAVGKALLSCNIMLDMDRGVAIKIRDSLKSRND